MQLKKPSHLRLEPAPTVYSDAMPDIRQALEWVSLEEANLVATQANRPIFAVVASPWSTGAHLVCRELESPDIRTLISEHFVPILVDPVVSPAQSGTIAALARHQGGSGSLPILAVLSPQLHPAFAITYSSPEHRPSDIPSTQSLLQSIAEQWETDPASFDTEWQQSRSELQPTGLNLEDDRENGGFTEHPRHLHSYMLVDRSKGEGAGDPWLLQTLTTLWDHGIRDQLEASFHPQTRNASWAIPFFEKIMPQNAAMALVYARAAKQTDNRALRSQAQDLVRVVLSAVLQKTDVISADSQYYTWTSTEAFDTLSRENLQPVSLTYNILPSGTRQVLNKVRTIDDLESLSYEPRDLLERRYLAGNAELLMHRRTRPAPRPLSLDNQAWRAESYRWLLLAMESLESSDQSLLINSLLSWATGDSVTTRDADVTDAASFQGQVSLLASLLLASSRTSDTSITALLPHLLESVQKGIQYWQSLDEVDQLWLRQHGYLPSVMSTLEAIQEMLLETASLEPLQM